MIPAISCHTRPGSAICRPKQSRCLSHQESHKFYKIEIFPETLIIPADGLRYPQRGHATPFDDPCFIQWSQAKRPTVPGERPPALLGWRGRVPIFVVGSRMTAFCSQPVGGRTDEDVIGKSFHVEPFLPNPTLTPVTCITQEGS